MPTNQKHQELIDQTLKNLMERVRLGTPIDTVAHSFVVESDEQVIATLAEAARALRLRFLGTVTIYDVVTIHRMEKDFLRYYLGQELARLKSESDTSLENA